MISKQFATKQIARLAAFPDEFSRLKPQGVEEYAGVLRGCADEAQAVGIMDSLLLGENWPTLRTVYLAVQAESVRAREQAEIDENFARWKREAEPAQEAELAALAASLQAVIARGHATLAKQAEDRQRGRGKPVASVLL